ncbi:MAG: hypothetical protein ACYDH3_04160 [Candidatus Aminicenantales bacterium]
MDRLNKILRLTTVLGILSLVAAGIAHLALTDIHHGEADLTLEWWVLRVCAAIILAFIACALILVRNVRRTHK